MCRTQSITHTCEHTINFRLSVCAASFQFQTRRGEVKAKCCASPSIILHSLHACGPCERETVQRQVTSELAAIEAQFPSSGWMVPDEVQAAQIQADQSLWTQFRGLPDSKFKVKKLPKPERGWSTITAPKGSLLRSEVLPGDIVNQDEWGGYLSLSDEIANIEAERAADGMPPLAPMFSVFEDDGNWGNVKELGARDNDISTRQEHHSTSPTCPDAEAVQGAKEKSTAKSAFVPPHQRHRQRLQERAKHALLDTKPLDTKHTASEATNAIRCCAVPLMRKSRWA